MRSPIKTFGPFAPRLTAALCASGLALVVSACGDDTAAGPSIDGTGVCTADNRPPHIDPIGDRVVSEGENLRIVVTVTDPDDDTLYLTPLDTPGGSSFDLRQGTMDWRPASDTVRAPATTFTTEEITVRVDDNCLVDETTFTITVQDVNQPPFFLSAEGAQISLLDVQVEPETVERVRFQVVDPDGDELTMQLDGSPVYARLEDDTLVLSPSGADTGTDEFEIIATDGRAEATLNVMATVGALEVEVPAPTGLNQSNLDGLIAVGEDVFEGRITFLAAPHAIEGESLRFSVEVAEVGAEFDTGLRATSDALVAGEQPLVDIELEGGVSYRWRARFLSDSLGAGPYASFGGNADTSADLVVSIVPHTDFAFVPNDPSPRDVSFGFYSDNVTRFECSLDGAEFESCATTACPTGSLAGCVQRNLSFLAEGRHTFAVRGVTTDGVPDPTPAEYSWTVIDLANPRTTFSPAPPSSVSCGITAHFQANQTDVTYECKLERTTSGGRPPECSEVGDTCSVRSDCDTEDGQICHEDGGVGRCTYIYCLPPDFVPCTSPQTYNFASGVSGAYRVSIRATNVVGLSDNPPLTHDFTVSCP